MSPLDYFEETSEKAIDLFGPRCPEFDGFNVRILFDNPGYKPQTYHDFERKETVISLNDYTTNYEDNHAFLDELAHETIHTLCPCAEATETLRIEEGLGEYFAIAFVTRRMKDDYAHRRDSHLNGIHGGSLQLVEAIPKLEETIKSLRAKQPCISKWSKDDLIKAGISEKLAAQLLEHAYPKN